MADQQQPPLWCIPLAVILALIAMVVIGWPFLQKGDPFNRALARAHTQYLIEAKAAGADEVVVVGLGTSLMKHALRPGDAFTAAAVDARLPSLRMVRLLAQRGLETLDDQTLQALAELKPPVLLVQSNVLFYVDPRQGYVGFSEFIRDRLAALIGRSRNGSPARRVQDFYKSTRDQQREVGTLELAQKRTERIRSYAGGPRPDVLRAIELCRQHGGKVFILPIPSDPSWTATFDDDELEVRRHIDALVADGLAQELSCPLTFTTDDYFDLRHLNEAAAQRYSRWLLKELAQRLGR